VWLRVAYCESLAEKFRSSLIYSEIALPLPSSQA
jgi:hypothetical protein